MYYKVCVILSCQMLTTPEFAMARDTVANSATFLGFSVPHTSDKRSYDPFQLKLLTPTYEIKP